MDLRRLQGWIVPLALLGAVLLSYGIWIPWMGLFGDDLSYLWYYHLLGPWGPGEFAAMDRPLSAGFYAASTFLLGESVWPYHVFLLALRWLSGLLLWWVLRLVWPERKLLAATAALLFVVYPGFRQNPIALEFILHFFVLDLFLLSLAAMLLAVCRLKGYWPLSILSAVGAAGVFTLEYFAGLEVLRPILLWVHTRRQGLSGRRQWQAILRAWLPALLVFAGFLFWRVFVFSFPTYKPVLFEELRASPVEGLLHLGRKILSDLTVALPLAWKQTLTIPTGRLAQVVTLALVILSAGGVFLSLWWAMRQSPAASRRGGAWMAALGLLAMLAGGSIFWVTYIPVELAFPWDRSTLSLMLGASLLTAGLLEMLFTARYQALAAAILVGLAVGMHFQNAREYRYEWQKLQSFYWQLTWRAPELEAGTLILFDVIPLNRYSDNDMTAFLNWTYAPGLETRQTLYKFFDLTIRLDTPHAGLPGLEKGLPVEHNHRGLFFKTTTSHTIALEYQPPGCLRILSPEEAAWPGMPERLARVLPMTSLEWIGRDEAFAARPPAQLGIEPEHGWCYYFQKADLARQYGDWTEAAALGDAALAAGLTWNDPLELRPFIEGYAYTGQWERAVSLTEKAAAEGQAKSALCAVWGGIGADAAAQEVESVRQMLACGP